MVWKSAKSEITERRDPMQEFANRIVEALDAGVIPWHREWDPDKCGGPQAPVNGATGDRYHGINTLILGMDMRAFQSGDPRWATYKQAQEKGWQVKKGEKATTVFFYKPHEIEDEAAEDGKRTIPILKHFSVFHATQIEGIPAHRGATLEEAPWAKPEATEIILRNSGAVVRTGGDKAFFSPGTDHIQLPPASAFDSPSGYAVVILHELYHWTGHYRRLDRALDHRFGSSAYAMEELRAEIASSFIGGELGLPTKIPNHAAYICTWLKALKNDKREIFRAAADAQKGVDMILGFHPDFAAKQTAEAKPDRPLASTPANNAQAPTL